MPFGFLNKYFSLNSFFFLKIRACIFPTQQKAILNSQFYSPLSHSAAEASLLQSSIESSFNSVIIPLKPAINTSASAAARLGFAVPSNVLKIQSFQTKEKRIFHNRAALSL